MWRGCAGKATKNSNSFWNMVVCFIRTNKPSWITAVEDSLPDKPEVNKRHSRQTAASSFVEVQQQ
jgi:hypothetical protein